MDTLLRVTLGKNDEMLAVASEHFAAGRIDDAIRYIELLHQAEMEIANFVDRSDECKAVRRVS